MENNSNQSPVVVLKYARKAIDQVRIQWGYQRLSKSIESMEIDRRQWVGCCLLKYVVKARDRVRIQWSTQHTIQINANQWKSIEISSSEGVLK